jgi:hypothetical protein
MVCEPSNALEGHMLQDLLQQRGITARLEGAGLQGAAGELPVTGLVRLVVKDDDFAEARAVIDEWEKIAVADPIRPPLRRPAGAFSGALVGLVLGISAAYIYFRVPVNFDGIDYDRDRILDERWKYSPGGTPIRTEIDRNLDGDVDLIWTFDRHSQVVSGESDDDFNGTFESRSKLRNGQAHFAEVDTDGDSIPDLKSFFKHGVLISVEYISKDSGKPVRLESFHLGKLVSAEVDTDRDDTLDRRYLYDDVGDIATVEEIK